MSLFDFFWVAVTVVLGGLTALLKRHSSSWHNACSILFWVMLSVFLVRSLFWEMYMTDGPSMSPALQSHSLVMIDKTSYGVVLPLFETAVVTSMPHHNEVVAFRHLSEVWIKRVKGGPGDVLEYRDNEGWFVNGQWVAPVAHHPAANEWYWRKVGSYQRTSAQRQWDEQRRWSIVVPPHSLFVVGDNFAHSTDSRSIGFVSTSHLLGQVRWRNP